MHSLIMNKLCSSWTPKENFLLLIHPHIHETHIYACDVDPARKAVWLSKAKHLFSV